MLLHQSTFSTPRMAKCATPPTPQTHPHEIVSRPVPPGKVQLRIARSELPSCAVVRPANDRPGRALSSEKAHVQAPCATSKDVLTMQPARQPGTSRDAAVVPCETSTPKTPYAQNRHFESSYRQSRTDLDGSQDLTRCEPPNDRSVCTAWKKIFHIPDEPSRQYLKDRYDQL